MKLKKYKITEIAQIFSGYPFKGSPNFVNKTGIDDYDSLNLFENEVTRLISYNDIKSEPTIYIKPNNLPQIEFNGLTTFLITGDIIISNRKNYIGKVIPNFSLDYKIIAREFLTIIRPKKFLIIPEFLYMKFFEIEIKDYLLSNMSGDKTKFISKKTFENLSFNIPPMKEQKRLVDSYIDIEKILIGLQRKKDALIMTEKILSYGFTDEFKKRTKEVEAALLKSDNLEAPIARLKTKLKKNLYSLGIKT
jgi:restriction endonuclease S subunit